MRALALLLLVAACERHTGSDDPPGYAPRPAPPPVVVPDAAPAPDAPPVRTVADVIDAPDHVCFAVSSNRRRAACAFGSWSNQFGSTLAIRIVGDTGDATSEWIYHAVEGMTFDGGAPAKLSAPDQLEAARRALTERGYQVSTDPRVPLLNHATITLAGWTFRRERITTHQVTPWKPGDGPDACCDWNLYEEHVDVKCGNRWVPVPVEDVRYDEPSLWLSRLNDRTALIELDADWGIEGEHGGSRSALALDVAALCRS